MRDDILQEIEQELLAAQSDDAAFEKHMYAIEKLARLAQKTKAGTSNDRFVQPEIEPKRTMETPPKHTNISQAELKAMGADVRAKTDDGLGNGESIFDF